MSILRRLLGILVMFAGILGLVLSLAGLIGVWAVRPTIANTVTSTIVTLDNSITTSQRAMEVTGEALGATVASVDALSVMLSSTATSVEDTKPIMAQLNSVMGETLPKTLEDATTSLQAAEDAAVVMESTIKSLEVFRSSLSMAPLISAFVPLPPEPYSPEKPLAESLGEVAADLESMPDTFTAMSANLDKADDNLDEIQTSLSTMANSVGQISGSLSEYQTMVGQSQTSMESLKTMLTNLQTNLDSILNGAALVFTLFFLWLLAAQIVILSQGWELFQGTAGRMEGGVQEEPLTTEAAA